MKVKLKETIFSLVFRIWFEKFAPLKVGEVVIARTFETLEFFERRFLLLLFYFVSLPSWSPEHFSSTRS